MGGVKFFKFIFIFFNKIFFFKFLIFFIYNEYIQAPTALGIVYTAKEIYIFILYNIFSYIQVPTLGMVYICSKKNWTMNTFINTFKTQHQTLCAQ